MKNLIRLAAGAMFLAGASTVSHASTFTSTLTEQACSGGCGPQSGGFGTVVVTDIATNEVSVVVTLLNGNEFVKTGAGDALDFDLNGTPTITFSSVTTGFSPQSGTETAGSNHTGGAGTFSYAVTCSGCGSGASKPLTGPLDFTLTASGLSAASFDDANTSGNLFAVDILSGTTGKTGNVFADTGTLSQTPLPATLPLLASGFGVLGLLGRRRKRKSQATA